MVDKSAGKSANVIQGVPGAETGRGTQSQGFAGGLRDLQGRYSSLVDLYEKQRNSGQKVAELLKALQQEVDAVIQIPAEVLGAPYTAAYLVSDAVVIMFDLTRDMTTKPLRSFPAAKIVAIVQACTPELKRLISEKEKSEKSNLKSLEMVARELEEAQAMFSQVKAEGPSEEPAEKPSAVTSVATKAEAEKDRSDSSDVDAVILAAVGESLKVLGQDANRGVMSLLEKRYGFSMKDIPYHPRGFMEILDELVGSSARLIEKRIVMEIKKTYPVEGETFYEVVRSLRGRSSPESGGAKKRPGDGSHPDPLVEVPAQEKGDEETAPANVKPPESDSEKLPAKGEDDGRSDVDEAVSSAVDKGLDVLGHDGKQVVLKLLEDRYGLRQEDIPQHPRGFVELLDGLVGSGGRVIEKEIISEISKVGPVKGDALYEVVNSMRERDFGAGKVGSTLGPVSLEDLVEDEEEAEVPAPSSTQAVAEPSPQAGTELTSAEARKEEPSPTDAVPHAYSYSFKLESKPVPISEFLIA
jgi:hypothetical protein